jgi:hypothetical protein
MIAGTTTSTTSLRKREIVYLGGTFEAGGDVFDGFFDMVSPQIIMGGFKFTTRRLE